MLLTIAHLIVPKIPTQSHGNLELFWRNSGEIVQSSYGPGMFMFRAGVDSFFSKNRKFSYVSHCIDSYENIK